MKNKHLIKFGNDIKEIIELTDKAQYCWYGSNKPCFLVRFFSFAPISELASIESGRYADNKETGYIHGNGNLGTNSILIDSI